MVVLVLLPLAISIAFATVIAVAAAFVAGVPADQCCRPLPSLVLLPSVTFAAGTALWLLPVDCGTDLVCPGVSAVQYGVLNHTRHGRRERCFDSSGEPSVAVWIISSLNAPQWW